MAKYKKVKAFDKQHRGGEYVWGTKVTSQKRKKRSITAEKHYQNKLKRKRRKGISTNDSDGGFDLPPEGQDDFNIDDLKVKNQAFHDSKLNEIPMFSMPTISSSSQPPEKVKDSKVQIRGKTVTCTIPKDDADERRIAKTLNIDPKTGKTMSTSPDATHIKIEGRREGESMRAFQKRLREQTRMALAHDFKKRTGSMKHPNSDKSTQNDEERVDKKKRRKEFMKCKKLKKKKGKNFSMIDSQSQNNDGNSTDIEKSDTFITGEDAVVASLPSFLGQAEAPPTFNSRPRGAHKTAKQLKKSQPHDGIDENAIKAEQHAMEAMRRKVQAQYSATKERRRKERSFHL